MGGVSFPPNASEGSLCVPSCPSGVGNTRPGFAATPRISRARKPRAGFCQLPPPVCVLLGETGFQNWGIRPPPARRIRYGSVRSPPLDAQTRSLYVLSHPPGEPESFSRLLAYPCLLGTCKTCPETAGVLLCMCWLSSPFRAAQNPTKSACKLLAFERRRAGSLCAFLSPVRFARFGSPH